MRTIFWIRYPFPFRSDGARAMQETLLRLYGASGLQQVIYLIECPPDTDEPADGAYVDAVVLQGGDASLHRQIALTVQAIHLHRSLARSHVGTDWLHHPSLNVEITPGARPTWVPAWVPSPDEAWTFSTGTDVRGSSIHTQW